MQLYTLVRDVVIPTRTRRNPQTGEFRAETTTYPAAIAITNPDGAPNIYLEMYMLDVAGKYTIRRENGGSLKSIACSLTALARFCFTQHCQLWEMDDGFMKQAVGELTNEPNPLRPHQKKRDGNTVGRIVSDWVAFFRWLQQTIFPDRVIVGLIATNPQIVLVESMTTGRNGRGRISEIFPLVPVSATTEPKRPIGRELI